jgi:hypothetical protein
LGRIEPDSLITSRVDRASSPARGPPTPLAKKKQKEFEFPIFRRRRVANGPPVPFFPLLEIQNAGAPRPPRTGNARILLRCSLTDSWYADMCGSEETVRQLAPTGRLFRATSAVIYTVLSSSPTPHDDETGLKFKPLSRRVPFSLDSRGQIAELDGLFRRPIGRRRYGELHLLFSFPDLLCYVDI